jgi:ABC-type nitrate/sulfonate/bicarbonate transport system permease component
MSAQPSVEKLGRWTPLLLRIGSVVAVLLLWEWVGRGVNPVLLSYPTAIAMAAVEITQTGELPIQLLLSLRILCAGFFIACLAGVGLGIVIGRYQIAEYLLDPYINALYATPTVALIPLIMLWLGLGFNAKVSIVFLVAFFPIVVNTQSGVRNISASLVDIGRVFGASEREIVTKIVVPASLPFILTGVRLAIGRAVVGMVVAEMFTAVSGLGGLLILYSNTFDTAKMFVTIIVLALLGTGLTALVRLCEQRLAPWKETERARA